MEIRKPIHNAYKIVKLFEEEVAEYTGAPFAVSIDNCTNALFLCLKYFKDVIMTKYEDGFEIKIPSKTYLSVPQSIIHAGFEPVFDYSKNNWSGIYQLEPLPIYDSAKRLTSNMYISNSYMCLSFHIKKQISIGKGGMILTDDAKAVEWFKSARYEGRNEKLYHDDDIKMLGWNMYMTPQQAAHGLALMQNYPSNAPDLGENNGYRDLTEFTVFKNYKKINE
jgi:dTDP-4-amino-4,6-dideoxygalactose transaminase